MPRSGETQALSQRQDGWMHLASESGSVLVVDDDEQILNVLKLALEMSGYDVRLAATGERAIELAIERQPSLVLCDQTLPGVSGTDVLSTLRTIGSTEGIPFILMSGSRMVDDRCSHLLKPFELREAIRAVKENLLLYARKSLPEGDRAEPG